LIYIFTALYCEAYPVIRCFHLVKNNHIKRFQVFENKDSGIILTVTGSGSIKAAVAVGSIGTYYGMGENDFLINMGTCAKIQEEVSAECTGRIYLCNKITERTTKRTFYPDILFCHDFLEKEIVSAERPVGKKQDTEYGLFDMEAAAVYQAGAFFLGPHQMSFLKIVSDNGNVENVTAAVIEELVEQNMDKISEYILRLSHWCQTENEKNVVPGADETEWLEKVYRDMHCSDTMKAVLEQHVRYCTLTGTDYKKIVEELYLQGKLPCSCKREGKVYFEELRKKLL